MSYKIEQVLHEPLTTLGEGPHWDTENKRLYFVDIQESAIFSYNPETQTVSRALICNGEKRVSLIVPVENENNKYLISYGNDIASVQWNGVSDSITDFETIACTPDNPELRFNDGKCSPSGLLFAGTQEINFVVGKDGPGKAAMYVLRNNEAEKLLGGVQVSNGMAWSSDEKIFYYNDSMLLRVDCFDYDAANVKLSNRRTVFDFKANNVPGFPDGMTIDKDGNLWVATYAGGQIVHVDPTAGKLLNTIKMPTSIITSMAFGGQNLNELYVTTASLDVDTVKDPIAGCLFKISRLPTTGFPGKRAKL